MKAIKENWKLVLIVAAGIIAVIFMCIFGIQGAQNKAFAMEEQVNTYETQQYQYLDYGAPVDAPQNLFGD